QISRANLDGTDVEVLWNGDTASTPVGIALDLATGKMYWSDSGEDLIRRANLDGTDEEVVVDAAAFATGSNIYGVTLDAPAGRLYWADLGTKAIYRSNLDGSSIVPLVTGAYSSMITVAHATPGIIVSPRSGLVTTEAGGADAVQVSLTTR